MPKNIPSEIFSQLSLSPDLAPIDSAALKQVAKRPPFSAMETEKLTQAGLAPRPWPEALADYLLTKGYIVS